jgi:very-short-patch-repair endonuclease
MLGRFITGSPLSTAVARKLRKQQTPAEQKLWGLLRSSQLAGYKFRRQFPIGNYIVDFACFRHHLVVEADGGQHADNAADDVRTAEIEGQGWRLVRFWNNEIMQNSDGGLLSILSELERP